MAKEQQPREQPSLIYVKGIGWVNKEAGQVVSPNKGVESAKHRPVNAPRGYYLRASADVGKTTPEQAGQSAEGGVAVPQVSEKERKKIQKEQEKLFALQKKAALAQALVRAKVGGQEVRPARSEELEKSGDYVGLKDRALKEEEESQPEAEGEEAGGQDELANIGETAVQIGHKIAREGGKAWGVIKQSLGFGQQPSIPQEAVSPVEKIETRPRGRAYWENYAKKQKQGGE